MKNYKRRCREIGFLIAVYLISASSITAQDKVINIDSEHLSNFYRVDENLFRSEQPKAAAMKELEAIGIQSVLNLRRTKTDKRKARNTELELRHVRINTWTINYAEVVNALQEIKDAPKPVLVHCMHGSDRAGAVVAAYRIAFNGWTKEQALEELRFDGFGFHERWFPHIVRLIENIDEQQLRREVGIEIESTKNN
jgi:tyrosine-protein phosphatase SIW14